MKKLLLSIFVLGITLNVANAFDVNEFEIQTSDYQIAFDELSSLEEYVTEKDYTLTDLSVNNAELFSEIKLDNRYSAMSTLEGSEPPLGLPSFLWGFCCGVPGLAIVYFITDDSEETKKALWGCVAGNALYGVVWLIYYLVLVSYYY
jgi:hypothetical protein